MTDSVTGSAAHIRLLPESKECHFCHRIGYRDFVPMGDYGWACANDAACNRRQTRAR